MKTLLKNLEDLKGKTIESVEIETGYSSEVVIKTTDNCILVLSSIGDWDRCGDYEGTSICVETDFGYYDKERLDLLAEDDIQKHKVEEEKKRQERMKKDAEEKRKAEEAAEKVRKNELELLAKLKEKYEN
jgi:hypothetical protein